MESTELNLRTIALREISLPLREPFRISSGTTSHRRILLIESTDADGIVVWSECVAGEYPNYGPETVDTAWHAVREWVAPRVLGRSFRGAGEVRAALEENFRGHNMAKAAVEMGYWALEASRRDLSLAVVLGGTREQIEVGISLGMQERPSDLIDRVSSAVEAGYHRIKLKVAPGRDAKFVEAVREAFGEALPLSVDANSAYSLDEPDPLLALDRMGLMMIEQPLSRDDLRRHALLQSRLETPICLDESITGPEKVEDMLALGSGRIVNIKAGRVGGLASSLEIHRIAAENGIPVWCGGMLESGIGRAYNVALASLPNFTLPGDTSPSSRYWERDVVTPEWTMAPDGTVRVPADLPGLGVEVDRDRIEDLTVRSETVAA